MNFQFVVALCGLCTLELSNAQDEYAEDVEPEYDALQAEAGKNEGFQEHDKGPGGHFNPELHGDHKGQNFGAEGGWGKDEYRQEGDGQWSKEVEPDDDDPIVEEEVLPYINRGPPTRGETYKIAATMYTHLWIRRNKSILQTKRSKATVTPTVFWDQYFLRNRLKSKIKVLHVKAHYRREYRARLLKMVHKGVGGIILNRTHNSWDDLMDEYRPFREEQMIKADDRIFNKFIRRMDTVLQSGRYEKWRFHQNTTHKPWFNHEQNLLFTDRIDKKMIMEIRSLARSLRKDIHRYFDILDNQFLRTYFRIPHNISLYYRYPQPLNYTEQF